MLIVTWVPKNKNQTWDSASDFFVAEGEHWQVTINDNTNLNDWIRTVVYIGF